MTRVLLVEDDAQLQTLTARGLRHARFAVDTADDGREALDKASVTSYAVVVLDRDLPLVHGDDVCRSLVGSTPQPKVIMLTAFGEVNDRVEGLRLGADDYLPKPFSIAELAARVQALARRPDIAIAPLLTHLDVDVEVSSMVVTRGGNAIELTPKEFGVLVALLKASPGVLSAEHLLERVWDENVDPFTSAVKVTIANLRKKLGEPDIIRTRKGAGYHIG